jgi:signal peptidase II
VNANRVDGARLTSERRRGTPADVRKSPSKWSLLFAALFLLVLADQSAKFLAVDQLTTVFTQTGDLSLPAKLRGFFTYRHLESFSRAPHEVWNGYWRMRYGENPGAAFGLFVGVKSDLRFPFFTVVTLAAVAFVLGAYRKLREGQRLQQLALVLVLAGALGNYADRVARRYVIDFIDWGISDLRWPTFNVADVFLVVGVGLMLLPARAAHTAPDEAVAPPP